MALKRKAKTRCNSLVFFIALCLIACGRPTPSEIEIQYDNGRAKSVLIPKSVLGAIPSDSLTRHVSIRLASSDTQILGSFDGEHEIIFTPLIPFTPGLSYDVFVKDGKVTSFVVPEPDPAAAPVLTEVYPTQDTVPMNLLKIYLRFSKPMRAGEGLKHIILTRSNGDTAQGVFLDLQQELWNEEQTTLTLWLDPGRIKRDLKPNKILGNPLEENETYTLRVDHTWKDQLGGVLVSDRTKTFYVANRDSISPLPSRWKVLAAHSGTVEPVKIDFGESLDFSLVGSAIHMMCKGVELHGLVTTGLEEKSWLFTPSEPWAEGNYVIEIESRLEDLAGNNLNRPFDRDMTTTSNIKTDGAVSLPFVIR